MIDAPYSALLIPTVEQACEAVRAELIDHTQPATTVSENDQIFAEQLDPLRRRIDRR
jgi:hypothetical protein